MSTALATLAGKLAERVGMDSVDPLELITTLRQTAFKGDASDAQFIALLIVANQYGLNPWTKEIYAFPDKQNGIVLNRPGFPGECFICELRLPDHRF